MCCLCQADCVRFLLCLEGVSACVVGVSMCLAGVSMRLAGVSTCLAGVSTRRSISLRYPQWNSQR